jgi:hypothetical protein
MIMEGFLDVLALLDQSLRVQGLALTLLISIIINVFKIDFYIIIIIIIIINVQMKTRKVSLSSIKTKQNSKYKSVIVSISYLPTSIELRLRIC